MHRFRRFVALGAAVLATSLLIGPAGAQTQQEVDEARERLDEAKEERAFVEDELEVAIIEYQLVNGELLDLTYRMGRLQDNILVYEADVRALKNSLRQRVIRAYMSGGTDRIEVFFDADNFNDVITRQSVLAQAAARDQTMLERLTANSRQMERLRDDLEAEQDHIQELSVQAEDLMHQLNALWDVRDEVVDEADAEYQDARRRRAEELARRRAAELAALARKQGAGGGVPADATPGFICPVAGPHRFINDWGFPRSGGRTHKGTDMFAARGTKLVAVGNGTITLRNGGLGGVAIWLRADHGVSYYYAHLDRWASGMSNGTRVSRGQVIGYVGNSGNAVGGATHNHFQLHPGGGAPVNPYPTLVRACR